MIGALGFHLGPEVQMRSVHNGYDQLVEDAMLAACGWEDDAYRLFDVSVLAGSSVEGWFALPNETNSLFLTADHWRELGGYDRGFVSPGGGFANLDIWARLCADLSAEVILLLGEATFHQVHNGVATNSLAPPRALWTEEYERLRGRPYISPVRSPTWSAGFILEPGVGSPARLEPSAWVGQRRRRGLIALSSCWAAAGGTRMLANSHAVLACSWAVAKRQRRLGWWVDTIYDLALDAMAGCLTAESERDLFWRVRLRRLAAGILEAAGRSADSAWGWKLPETMLALGSILRAFPRAKVVHLVRHPLTSSLRRTHLTSRLDNRIGQAVLTSAYLAGGLDPWRIRTDDPYVHNAVTWNYQVAARWRPARRRRGCSAASLRSAVRLAPERAHSLAGFIGLPVSADAEICRVDEARTNPTIQQTPEPIAFGDLR